MRVKLLASLLLLGWTAPALAKSPDIFPLSQVRKGQKGYGLTVFEGTKPERFEFEVLGVLKQALPKQDLILVRSNDQKIIERGFARGMSGSPLFLDGKVACAFSYGFPFSKGQIGGCTPIEYMLEDARKPIRGPEKAALASSEEWNRLQPLKRAIAAFDGETERGPSDAWLLRAPLPTPPRQPTVAYGSEGSLVRAGIPLSIAGISQRGFDEVKRIFEPFGIEPVQGVSGGGDPTRGPTRYELGGVIGGVLSRGDVSMVGTGTVSYVDGKTISAFGHPFFQMGETYMPATTGEIHVVVPSTNMAFKLSSPLRPLGTLIQDRQASITVDASRTVDMVPVEIRITSPNGKEVVKSEVLRHRFLTPPLVGMMVVEAARLLAPDVADTTVTIDSTLHVKGYPPISFKDYQYSPDGVSGAITGARALRVLTPLVFNPFAPVRIERVDVDVTIDYKADYTEIDHLRVADVELPYGKKTYVDVVLRPYAGKPYNQRIPLTIPERLAGSQVRLEVVPGDDARPDVAPPESLEDVMATLHKTYPANTLVVTLYTPDEGVTLGGKVIPNLPDSALDTARPVTSTRRGEAYRSIARTVVPSKRVVTGRAELTIKVQDKK